MAQVVAPRLVTPEVAGSSPAALVLKPFGFDPGPARTRESGLTHACDIFLIKNGRIRVSDNCFSTFLIF
jgi:hypothetical protein